MLLCLEAWPATDSTAPERIVENPFHAASEKLAGGACVECTGFAQLRAITVPTRAAQLGAPS